MRLRLAVLALLLVPGLAYAQTQQRATLAHQWDMDGEAADDDQVVTVADLLDSTTFALAAQPDSCRLIDMTVVDANSSITAGTVTLVGTDCLGYARTCAFDFAPVATRGSGVKAIPVTVGPAGSSCYLASVTSVKTSALTGEGGAGVDTVKVGYTTNSALAWPAYGVLATVGPNGEHRVDPFSSLSERRPITTSGTSSTTVTAVGSNGAFADVAVGDLLTLNLGLGVPYERRVTAKASANSITVHAAVVIPATGVPFTYQHRYVSTDPTDEMVIPVAGFSTAQFIWQVAANAATGGVVTQLQCRDAAGVWVTLPQTVTTVASGATTVDAAGLLSGISESIVLGEAPYTACRQGFRFGTGDDADAANEQISLSVVRSR